MRSLLAITASLVVLTLVALPAFLLTHRADLAEIDDADLAITRLDLATEDNGFTYLERAVEALAWPEDAEWVRTTLRGEAWDADRVRGLLDDNVDALRHARHALRAEGFEAAPYDPITDDTSTDWWFGWLNVGRLLGLEALTHAHAGEAEAWQRTALEAVWLGHRVATAAGVDQIRAILGSAIKGKGLVALRSGAAKITLTAEQARRIDRALAATAGDGRSEAWRVEYHFMRTQLARLGPGFYADADGAAGWLRFLPEPYAFQPHRTAELLASQIRGALERRRRPCVEARRSRLEPASFAVTVGPNGAGEILVRIASQSIWDLERLRCEADTAVAATRSAIGLRTYQLDRGTLPERLDGLVPHYLDAVPRDGFDGQPLRWSRAQRLLWSVGADFEDPPVLERTSSAGEPRFPVLF